MVVACISAPRWAPTDRRAYPHDARTASHRTEVRSATADRLFGRIAMGGGYSLENKIIEQVAPAVAPHSRR